MIQRKKLLVGAEYMPARVEDLGSCENNRKHFGYEIRGRRVAVVDPFDRRGVLCRVSAFDSDELSTKEFLKPSEFDELKTWSAYRQRQLDVRWVREKLQRDNAARHDAEGRVAKLAERLPKRQDGTQAAHYHRAWGDAVEHDTLTIYGVEAIRALLTAVERA